MTSIRFVELHVGLGGVTNLCDDVTHPFFALVFPVGAQISVIARLCLQKVV